MSSKRIILISILSICFAIAILSVFLLTQKQGAFTVTVFDAYTNEPLENAAIVVAENDISFKTDKNGKALCSPVMFRPNKYFRDLRQAQSGTVTLLCYMDGYLDFILFNASVFDVGIYGKTLYMFPENSESNRTFIAMNETPDEEFSKKLLDKYAKKYK